MHLSKRPLPGGSAGFFRGFTPDLGLTGPNKNGRNQESAHKCQETRGCERGDPRERTSMCALARSSS